MYPVSGSVHTRMPSQNPAAFVLAACKVRHALVAHRSCSIPLIPHDRSHFQEYLKPARNRRVPTFWPTWIRSRPWPATATPQSAQFSTSATHLRPPAQSTVSRGVGASHRHASRSLSPLPRWSVDRDEQHYKFRDVLRSADRERSQRHSSSGASRHDVTRMVTPSPTTPSASTIPRQPRRMSTPRRGSTEVGSPVSPWTASSYDPPDGTSALGNAFSRAALDRQMQTPRLLRRKPTPESRSTDSYADGSQEEIRVRGCAGWR
ncbi:hypothetical protein IE81DRAFT_97399 [Ceraceosorus guamensis]|uniref:Uncharacterized protein n=1 Tax=Ceraceosorus guamensis TaxID=1522189 RepID=A0A316W652_9BASI|nr:hypothetical protein IE81DRAFT_97399 [Ceraceosorus guamensis]PWN43135.1 hypothetical protein IE81DRAFT_97399 [Ceraceosorus guamensis]